MDTLLVSLALPLCIYAAVYSAGGAATAVAPVAAAAAAGAFVPVAAVDTTVDWRGGHRDAARCCALAGKLIAASDSHCARRSDSLRTNLTVIRNLIRQHRCTHASCVQFCKLSDGPQQGAFSGYSMPEPMHCRHFCRGKIQLLQTELAAGATACVLVYIIVTNKLRGQTG